MIARIALVLASVAMLAAVVSGCGEDSEVTAAQPAAPPGLEGEAPDPEALEDFQSCLEAEGVDAPDPSAGPPDGREEPSADDREAFERCADELPGDVMSGPPGGPPGFAPSPGDG